MEIPPREREDCRMAQQLLKIVTQVNAVVGILFLLFYAYQMFYIPLPWLKKAPKHKGEAKANSIAVLICARNEECVIPDLLRSLKAQTYTAAPIRVFVCADNCTDGTAQVARAEGATVYERFSGDKIGKGYALAFLLDNIRRDIPEGFDTYYIFDADNLLRPDYLEKMNREFSDGYEIVTSYRNSKNYGQNWVSAGMGLRFIRDSRYLNHSRKLLHTSCAVSGTGFGFSRSVLEEMGWTWPYFTLTEDIEFSVDHVMKGYTIGMAQDAEFFDEQPVKFSQSWRQRKRWAKGCLQCQRKYGLSILRSVFQSFAHYDVCLSLMPVVVLSIVDLLTNLTVIVLGIVMRVPLPELLLTTGKIFLSAYGTMFVIGAVTTVSEWKHLHTTTFKKILYAFTFPIFMLTYIPNAIAALFGKAQWLPIDHNVTADSVPEEMLR